MIGKANVQSSEEATVNAMLAIVEAVRNPESMLTKAKQLVELNTLSDARKKEAEAAVKAIEDAKVASEQLELTKKAHEDAVNKAREDIDAKRSKLQDDTVALGRKEIEINRIADGKLASAAEVMKAAEKRHADNDAREQNLAEREAKYTARMGDIKALESDYAKRVAKLKDEEEKAALRKKRILDAARED